jgi:hypothetical protein
VVHRTALLLAVALCATATATALLGAGRADAEQVRPAVASLSRCLESSDRLSVLMLIDESKSLRGTDRSGQRVAGMKAALAGLARVADGGEDSPDVEILLAGFSGVVEPGPEDDDLPDRWRALDGASLGDLTAEAADFEDRDDGRDTDYGTALLAARQILAQRAGELTSDGSDAPCKALIWFTDGKYRIRDRTDDPKGLPPTVDYSDIRLDQPGAGDRAVAAGRRFLCRDDGLVDGLVSDGVVRFTVVLSRSLTAPDSAFLANLTTGSGGCGSRAGPETGEILAAPDSDRLYHSFGELLQVPPPDQQRPGVCPLNPCPRGLTSFTTVPGLSGFLLRATTGDPSVRLFMRGPDGKTVWLDADGPGEVSASGATLDQHWASPTAVEVEGSFSAGEPSWVGGWSFAFVDPRGRAPGAVPIATIQLDADLEPALAGARQVVVGQPTMLEIELIDSAGKPVVDGPLFDAATVTATLAEQRDGRSSSLPVTGPDADGRFQVTADLPESSSSGYVYLDVATTFDSPGAASVVGRRRSFRIPTRLPDRLGYPSITPVELGPASIDGKGSTETTITVTGSRDAAGCAWLGEPEAIAPEGSGQIVTEATPDATSRQRCVRVAPGEEKDVRLRFSTTDGHATGTARVTVPIQLESEIAPGLRTLDVDVSFEVYTPRDVTKRLWMLFLLMGVGIALPVGLLHALNWAGAKFTAPEVLAWLGRDVVIVPGDGVVDADGGGELKVRYNDFRPVDARGAGHHERDLAIGDFDLATIASGSLRDREYSLFRGPYAVTTAAGSHVLAGGRRRLRSWRKGLAHEVPLTLPETWLFRIAEIERAGDSPRPERVKGRLVLVISESGDIDQGERVASDAVMSLQSFDWSSIDTESAAASEGRLGGLLARARRLLPARDSADEATDAEGPTIDLDADDWDPRPGDRPDKRGGGRGDTNRADGDPHDY